MTDHSFDPLRISFLPAKERRELLGDFERQLIELHSKIAESVLSGNAENAGATIHKLYGSSISIGAICVAEIARNLSALLDQGRPDDTAGLLAQLNLCVEKTCQEINAYCSRLA